MEVRETAACGISQREFMIGLDEDDLVPFYRIFRYAQDGTGFYDQGFLDDLKTQMLYIIGHSLEDEASEEACLTNVCWDDEGGQFDYGLKFKESEAKKIYKILNSVDTPGEGFDKELNQKILDQLLELAPALLKNLPMINR
jgi:hypothetical protein